MFFKKQIEVQWSDIDANQHVTHSAYANFATHARVSWLNHAGFSMNKLLTLGVSAILTHENLHFIREIFLGEIITVELYFAGESADHSHWKFINKIFNAKGKLAATDIVTGVWLNIITRKISAPPSELVNLIQVLPKITDFEILDTNISSKSTG